MLYEMWFSHLKKYSFFLLILSSILSIVFLFSYSKIFGKINSSVSESFWELDQEEEFKSLDSICLSTFFIVLFFTNLIILNRDFHYFEFYSIKTNFNIPPPIY
jgi:hypothetical protein